MGKGYKVVLCGMASVGKTAILEQLLYGKHTVGLEEGATVEDVYLASVETDRGVKEQLRLYDTTGLEEGVEFPKHYFSVADGFVLVYAVNSLESFQRAEVLKKEIDAFRDKKEVTVVVLGNKTDLTEQRQVETEVAQQWAKAEKKSLSEEMSRQHSSTECSHTQKLIRSAFCSVNNSRTAPPLSQQNRHLEAQQKGLPIVLDALVCQEKAPEKAPSQHFC
ncbi:NF-kappa-B inhibitor-interacting Ras-like protein 1 isoform X2 [Carettochelys insculpta]|uniref:NF-kappa-B inhibitor-interacting Ras-like protein 1 isoform X2 n=1 Tax=Carettochelys insculpta TaxID=44489 RepID=UPI003EC0C633